MMRKRLERRENGECPSFLPYPFLTYTLYTRNPSKALESFNHLYWDDRYAPASLLRISACGVTRLSIYLLLLLSPLFKFDVRLRL